MQRTENEVRLVYSKTMHLVVKFSYNRNIVCKLHLQTHYTV